MGNTSSSANPRHHNPSSSISSSSSPSSPNHNATDSPRRAASSRRSRSQAPANSHHRSHLSHSTTTPNSTADTPPSPSPASSQSRTEPASDALGAPSGQQHQNQNQHQQHQQGESESTPTQEKKLPHRSLRTKKRSLELPDLSLALTPAGSVSAGMTSTAAAAVPPAGSALSTGPGAMRRPQASSPIAIPNRVGATPNAAAQAQQDRERERMRQIPTVADVLAPAEGQGRGRGMNAHIRGAPLQYNSTRSFAGTSRGGPGYTYTDRTGQERTMQSFALRSHPHGGFVPEDVHSSIPLALRKAEDADADAAEGVGSDGSGAADGGGGVGAEEVRALGAGVGALGLEDSAEETERAPTQVCIVYRHGGRDVKLLRAGDNNWKGRTQMEYDETTNEWRAWVPLMPGTHHIRFLVDGQVTTAEDLPTAVDDNGTIANYVAVPLSGNTPPSATLLPATKEQQLPLPLTSTGGAGGMVGGSFFADAQANPNEDAAWTDRVPWQLECAAEEEEAWLTHGQQARSQPPQHPQAPSLPRHLEKLIMNQKMPGSSSSRSGGSSSKSGGSSRSGGGGGALSSVIGNGNGSARQGSQLPLPVVTASGTNLSAGASNNNNNNNTVGVANFTTKEMYTRLVDAAGSADDGSVLPVPSHVVLHHLGTSAIRNGVLAVADTMRYKKKYVTTIYYKPT